MLVPARRGGGHRALARREQGSGTREVLERALAAHALTMRPPTVELTTATALREAVRSLRAVWRGSATPPAGPVCDLVGIAEAGGRTSRAVSS